MSWWQQFQCQCDHEAAKVVWKPTSGGGRQLRRQCDRCGRTFGPALRRELAAPDTPYADEEKERQWEAARERAYAAEQDRRVALDEAWRSLYDAYLGTDEWRRRRRLVIERAGGMCEGCRERTAEQVHHLNYTHVCNEFLFELVAVCVDCHARIHGGSRV